MARRRVGRPRKLQHEEEGPTPERRRKGDVERLERSIADEEGRPARPFRTMDTLARMLRGGSINAAMHQAGEDFRAVFAAAQLDGLRAPDLARVPQTLRDLEPTARQAEARKRVWHALKALGGIASPAGSCVWHVVGCEWSLRDWSLREGWGGRPLSQETAAGILVGALGVLQAHYGL
ncbi:MAG TPA: DUF6456 domain-containing protein [Stellaceae bacterium]|nr:DUF6456 domain-containing protein [Stellaceae bacterium]